MAFLLVGHPGAGILVSLGAVAAMVRRDALVHVHVPDKDGLLGETLATQLTAVGQLVPRCVCPQNVTW